MDDKAHERERQFTRTRAAYASDKHPETWTGQLYPGLYETGLHVVTGPGALRWATGVGVEVAVRGAAVRVLSTCNGHAGAFESAARRRGAGGADIKYAIPAAANSPADALFHAIIRAGVVPPDLVIITDRDAAQALTDASSDARLDPARRTGAYRDTCLPMLLAAASAQCCVLIVDAGFDPRNYSDPAAYLCDVALDVDRTDTSDGTALAVSVATDTRGALGGRGEYGTFHAMSVPGSDVDAVAPGGHRYSLGPEIITTFVPAQV